MVLHQRALQDTGKGAEGANCWGAAGSVGSSWEGIDNRGMMSWARRRSEMSAGFNGFFLDSFGTLKL